MKSLQRSHMLCILTGAYSVHLKWREPEQPNGLITHYRLVYKKHQQDPTLNSTTVTALTVEVNAHTCSKWRTTVTHFNLGAHFILSFSDLISYCTWCAVSVFAWEYVSVIICDACEEIWTLPVVLVPSVWQWGAWRHTHTLPMASYSPGLFPHDASCSNTGNNHKQALSYRTHTHKHTYITVYGCHLV